MSEKPSNITIKAQPEAVELEKAVLGALMLEPDALHEVIDFLRPRMFYKEEHQIIYRAILKLFDDKKPIDILTITDELQTSGQLSLIGGPYYISQLTDRIASSANIEYHARIIAQKFILREEIKMFSKLGKAAYEDTEDPFDLLDTAQNEIGRLSGILEANRTQSIREVIVEMRKKRKENKDKKKEPGINISLSQVQEILGGWHKTDLIIIAARPGMGKTSFVLTELLSTAQKKKPVAIFSLEMTSEQLVMRLAAQVAKVNIKRVRSEQLNQEEEKRYTEAEQAILNLPIYIDDTPSISTRELRSKAIRIKRKYKVELLAVDYLQLMSVGVDVGKKSRDQQIVEITGSTKKLAKELDIPVIALSQLSRDVEKRSGKHKRPVLSDLRDGGSIEQDSDVVIFIYRPEYYKIMSNAEGRSTKGIAEIIIEKHRNGETGKVDVEFIGNHAKFQDLVEKQPTLDLPIEEENDDAPF